MLSSKRVQRHGERRLGFIGVNRIKDKNYDVLDCSCNDLTLVQFEDADGGITHCSAFAGKWIFDVNYERALPRSKSSLDLICSDPGMPNGTKCFNKIHRAFTFVGSKKNLKDLTK